MNKFLYNLKESRIFQFVVISIIILNAITIGVNTYELSEFTKQAINYLDYSITIFFVIEIIIIIATIFFVTIRFSSTSSHLIFYGII